MSVKMKSLAAAVAIGQLACAAPSLAAFPQVDGYRNPRVWRSQDLLNAIGITTHISYLESDSAYRNIDDVLSALRYLGVTNVREGLQVYRPDDPRLQPYYAMFKAGYKLTMTFPADTSETEGYPTLMQAIEASLLNFHDRYPGQVIGLEGTNEPDIKNDCCTFEYKSLRGAAAVAQIQIDLYNTVHGNAATASIPIWLFSLNSPPYDRTQYEQVYNVNPAVTHAFDIANRGTFGGLYSPEWRLSGEIYNQLDVNFDGTKVAKGPYAGQLGSMPIAVKEIDLPSLPKSNTNIRSVDYGAQAKVFPGTIFDTLILGSVHTNIYELADVYPDNSNTTITSHYGMFDHNLNPKPVATVLRNIFSLLRDTASDASSFTPKPVNISIPQFPLHPPGTQSNGSGYHLEVQRADGTYVIFIWYEPMVADQSTYATNPAIAPIAIKAYLGQNCKTSSIYDPLTDTTTTGPSNVSSIPISLPDHVIALVCHTS